MKVFLDANFLVAVGLRPNGDYRRALDASQDQFVSSEHLLTEVARNLLRLHCDPLPLIAEARSSMQMTERFDILPAGLPLEGSGDRQALAEAIGAECNLFVTSDTDFDALFGTRVKGVLIQKSRAYVLSVISRL